MAQLDFFLPDSVHKGPSWRGDQRALISGRERDEGLQNKLEQHAALIRALLQTHALLSAQAEADKAALASLARELDQNVHARLIAKRKRSGCCPVEDDNNVYQSGGLLCAPDDASTEDGPADRLPLDERLALLERLIGALEAVLPASAQQRVRELERLRDMSLALVCAEPARGCEAEPEVQIYSGHGADVARLLEVAGCQLGVRAAAA